MRAVVDIAGVNLLRLLRDRANLFFVFLLPIILIVALGAVYGGFSTARVGIVATDAGTLGDDLVMLIESGELSMEVSRFDSTTELQSAVGEGQVQAGVMIPAGYDAALRAGTPAQIEVVAKPEDLLSAVRQGVEAAVAEQSAQVLAANLASEYAGSDFDSALERARATQELLPGLDISLTSAGTSIFPADAGAFSFGAQSQVILFMFLTSMTAATQLILTRQYGVSRRMLATRTPVRSILAGELSGRFLVAMVQGVFIVVVSSLLFGVTWGNMLGATLVIVLFALISTGVAMIVGTIASNPDQAASIGITLGLVLGAIGGAMVPAELFGEPMTTISRLTPHAWAIDALRDLSFRQAAISDILVQITVLAGMALVLVATGVWSMRRSLLRS